MTFEEREEALLREAYQTSTRPTLFYVQRPSRPQVSERWAFWLLLSLSLSAIAVITVTAG